MESPYIFNIQKFSTHDGDGVRTTIFFKGCPLRCMWCHNPESQQYERQIIFHSHKCTACGKCVVKCPQGANRIEDGRLIFDRSQCTACGKCTDWCRKEARELAGKQYTIRELIKEVKKDQMFYEQSGGGVTLSGGEVMASQHMDYIEALCSQLHREGIRIFVDTSGYTPYENLKRLLPYVDVFLYDMKLMDPEAHKKYIGVDNQLILENLIQLSKDGAGIYIRLPIIGQVNATEDHIRRVIHFLTEHHIQVRQVSLLPYHDIGKGKYAALDRNYEEKEMSKPDHALMEHFKAMLEEHGFSNVKIGG